MKNYFESVVVEQHTSKRIESSSACSLFFSYRLNLCRGARHGIKMNGKLQRLQEQEEQRSSSPDPSVVPDVEKKKKKKKHKSVDSNE